jgi:hypothetical protein
MQHTDRTHLGYESETKDKQYTDPADDARHDRMVELVAVHARSTQTRLCRHRSRPGAARRIEATDRQIDRLVYELYGLTEEEIGIVEAASG